MDTLSIHDILISLHAASAVISFITGSVLIAYPGLARKSLVFNVYMASLLGLVAFLAGAILSNWAEYTPPERILFPGLFILGLYMLYRAQRASKIIKAQQNTLEADRIDHIGFTLISLFEGFIIVALVNAGAPGWLVGLLAILGVLLGRWLIGRAKRRIERL